MLLTLEEWAVDQFREEKRRKFRIEVVRCS